MTLPYTGAAKRGVLIVALDRGDVYGTTRPGYKPLAPSHRRAATGVHRPDSARVESDCHRGGGFDVCLWRGRQQEGAGRDRLRAWHGNGRGQLPGLAVLMERGKAWRGYPALSRPLTIMGVERRWFLLSATLGLAMWNAINSIVTGAVIFAVLYGVGFWAWKQDPNMLEILRASAKFRARYDPGKWAAAPWTLLIRR